MFLFLLIWGFIYVQLCHCADLCWEDGKEAFDTNNFRVLLSILPIKLQQENILSFQIQQLKRKWIFNCSIFIDQDIVDSLYQWKKVITLAAVQWLTFMKVLKLYATSKKNKRQLLWQPTSLTILDRFWFAILASILMTTWQQYKYRNVFLVVYVSLVVYKKIV